MMVTILGKREEKTLFFVNKGMHTKRKLNLMIARVGRDNTGPDLLIG